MKGLSSLTITNDGSYGYFTIIAIFKGSWLLLSPAMSYIHFLPLTYFPSSASYVPEDKLRRNKINNRKGNSDMAKEKELLKIGKNEKGTERKYEA